MAKKKIIEKLFPLKRSHQVVLLIIPFFLYLQTYWFDFSFHDDDVILLNNFQVLRDFNLHKLFFSDAWLQDQKIELYRPFQSLTYAIDNYFSGTNASGYHFHNILIFCIGIQLFYLFLLSLKLDEIVSFFLALIFSVHFLFAHTVSWIPARGDLYLFAFSISSLISYYAYLKKDNPIFLALAAIFYFGALLSKESAIVLMPLIYLVGYFFWNVDLKKLKSYWLLAMSIVLTALYLWMRSQSISTTQNILTLDGFIYNLPMIPEEVTKFFCSAVFLSNAGV